MARKPKSTKSWAKYPRSIEVNYWRSIRPVSLRVRKVFNDIIEPELGQLTKFEYVDPADFSMDASITDTIKALFNRMIKKFYGTDSSVDGDPKTLKFRNRLELQVNKAGKSLSRFHKVRYDNNANFVAGVDPVSKEPWLSGKLRDWTQANVALISDVPESAISDLEKLITNSVTRGDSLTYLREQIAKRLNKTDFELKRIARDQSNKLYGSLTKLRSEFNGWDFYEWDDSNDSRVRPDHKRLDGKIYKFSEPPVTVTSGSRVGEKNSPGEDIQCRCIALVIFDREVIVLLRKQSDGSYALPKTLAA